MPERKPWTQEEDKILKFLYDEVGVKKWSQIAQKMRDQYKLPYRNGKQCRQRYQNSLDASIKRTQWTFQEENYLYQLHDEMGNKWVAISKKIPGRTDNCVKNHFFSKLRKSVRKLNKVIYDHFKKTHKEIRLSIINKIIQATDEKFKSSPSISQDLIQSSSRLKSHLLEYSRDDENRFEGNLQNLNQFILDANNFANNYKRKPKKFRKNQACHPPKKSGILIVPKVQRFKIPQDAEQIYSDCDNSSISNEKLASEEQSIEIGAPPEPSSHNIRIKPAINKSSQIKCSYQKHSQQKMNYSLQKSDDVEIILRNAGILQNKNMLNMFFLRQSLSESRALSDKEKNEKFNLGQSIQNLQFLRESKEDFEIESKLFQSN